MKLYEIVFIGRQDLSQQQIEALGVSLCLFVSQNNGEVVRNEYCGFRALEYPIKKNAKGHYYIMQIKLSAESIGELDRIMRLNEDIIRHLVVSVEKFEWRDNIISQARFYNDDHSSHGMHAGRDTGYRNTSDRSIVREDTEKEVEMVDAQQ